MLCHARGQVSDNPKHFQSFKLGGLQIDNDRFEGTAALVRNGPE